MWDVTGRLLMAVLVGCMIVLAVIPFIARKVFRAYFVEKMVHLRTALRMGNDERKR